MYRFQNIRLALRVAPKENVYRRVKLQIQFAEIAEVAEENFRGIHCVRSGVIM